MLVSTIIPTISRSTLHRSVHSAIEQGYGVDEHEIIVVNDSGNPLPDADWQSHPQVRIVVTQRTERSMACNVGAALAQGKYLKFLHDDDYLLEGSLKALVETAEVAPENIIWFYGPLNRVTEADVFIDRDDPGPTVSGNLFALFVVQECLHVSNALIRRKAFLREGAFDTRLAMREDLDLEYRLALIGEFAYIPTPVAGIRVGQSGSSSNWSTFRDKSFEVRERTLSHPKAFQRLKESLKDPVRGNDAFLRGRIVRAYILTALEHLKGRHFLIMLSRLLIGLYFGGTFFVLPKFWAGFAYPRIGRAKKQEANPS